MFVADARPVLDDVDHSHSVSAAEVEFGLQPGQDIPGLGVPAETLRGSKIQDFLGGAAGLVFDGVEVGLERRGCSFRLG